MKTTVVPVEDCSPAAQYGPLPRTRCTGWVTTMKRQWVT